MATRAIEEKSKLRDRNELLGVDSLKSAGCVLRLFVVNGRASIVQRLFNHLTRDHLYGLSRDFNLYPVHNSLTLQKLTLQFHNRDRRIFPALDLACPSQGSARRERCVRERR
jgi:hypothetical protein